MSLPRSLRGNRKPLVATSPRAALCVVNPRKLAAAMPAGKTDVSRAAASLRIAAGFGRLFPKPVCRGQ